MPLADLTRKFTTSEKRREKDWPQDVMRHTFASNHLAAFRAEKTIAALGHGDYTMLLRHYRQIVSRYQAKAFWSLTPNMMIA